MERLAGKTALITGATGGIGRAIAFALAAEGVGLCLLGRNAAGLATVQLELQGAFQASEVRTIECDFENHFERSADRIAAEEPEADILVHSAGAILPKSVADTTPEDFDRQFNANIRAPFLLTQALLPQLRMRHGQIVFVNSSVAQQKGRANLGAYTASKSALLAFADSLRDEVNGDGVRVLSVYPGRTASRMQEIIHAFERKPYQAGLLLQPEDVANAVVGALKLPRTAEITDIAIRPFRKN